MARASYNANGLNGIDNREIAKLAADLSEAPLSVQMKVPAVIKKAAVNVRKDARQRAEQIRAVRTTLPAYPYSIGFTLKSDGTEADIGPSKRRGKQGALGNLLEYGGMFNAPFPHLQPALEAEAPSAAKYLAKEGADIL